VKNTLRKAVGTSAVLLLAFAGSAMAYSGHACHLGAPEIDPSLMGSGLALLVSGSLVLVERYRRR
jgi:hypothetical protein